MHSLTKLCKLKCLLRFRQLESLFKQSSLEWTWIPEAVNTKERNYGRFNNAVCCKLKRRFSHSVTVAALLLTKSNAAISSQKTLHQLKHNYFRRIAVYCRTLQIKCGQTGDWQHINVVPRSTMNTNGGTVGELTLKCKLKC